MPDRDHRASETPAGARRGRALAHLRARLARTLHLAWRAAGLGALDFLHSDDMTFAGSIAYYGLLSIFPFLLLMFLALSRGTAGAPGGTLVALIGRALPARFDFLVGQVQQLQLMEGRLSLAFVGVMLWAATGVFSAISSAVNYAWGVEHRRSFLKNKLVGFLMLIAAGVLLGAALVAMSVAQMSEARWFEGAMATVPGLATLRTLVVRNASTGVFVAVVALIYYYIPNAKVRWRDVWAGALLAGGLWRVAFAAFAFYLRDFSGFSLHGSIGAVVAFMVWIYISSAILLYGAEVSAAYARLRKHLPLEREQPAAGERR